MRDRYELDEEAAAFESRKGALQRMRALIDHLKGLFWRLPEGYRIALYMPAALAPFGALDLLASIARGDDLTPAIIAIAITLGGMALILAIGMAFESTVPQVHRSFWLGVYITGAIFTFSWLIVDIDKRATRYGIWWYVVEPVLNAAVAAMWPIWWMVELTR